MAMKSQHILAAALLFILAFPSQAQKQAFEVVSIKLNKSANAGGSMGPRASMFVATNMTLKALLMYAYRPATGSLLNEQIIGGPDWIKTDRFDVKAKPEGDEPLRPGEPAKAMVRSLLEDRFQLKLHREMRDLAVYNLVLAKKGPKVSQDQTPPDRRQAFLSFVSEGADLPSLPRGAMRMVTGPTSKSLVGTAVSISTVVALLQGQSDRPVIDTTGFDKLIDVHLEFTHDLSALPPSAAESAAPREAGPSIFTAIQEIGLKLEPAKSRMEVLVIDSVQRPSEN
jgi:uncharacterized protein (TIGR03435 family)